MVCGYVMVCVYDCLCMYGKWYGKWYVVFVLVSSGFSGLLCGGGSPTFLGDEFVLRPGGLGLGSVLFPMALRKLMLDMFVSYGSYRSLGAVSHSELRQC